MGSVGNTAAFVVFLSVLIAGFHQTHGTSAFTTEKNRGKWIVRVFNLPSVSFDTSIAFFCLCFQMFFEGLKCFMADISFVSIGIDHPFFLWNHASVGRVIFSKIAFVADKITGIGLVQDHFPDHTAVPYSRIIGFSILFLFVFSFIMLFRCRNIHICQVHGNLVETDTFLCPLENQMNKWSGLFVNNIVFGTTCTHFIPVWWRS